MSYPTHKRLANGKQERVQLELLEFDLIDERIQWLLDSAYVNGRLRGVLAAKRQELRHIDFLVAPEVGSEPLLPDSDLRPLRYDDWRNIESPYYRTDSLLCMLGWVSRLDEFLKKIELKVTSLRATGT